MPTHPRPTNPHPAARHGLDHVQLLLLSTLIYVVHRTHVNGSRRPLTVGALAAEIRAEVTAGQLPKNPIKTTATEWLHVCDLILADPKLTSYKLSKIYYHRGLLCFVAKDRKLLPRDANLIFRGTAQLTDWDDNALSSYRADSPLQLRAYQYLKRLHHRRLTAAGHSKGGNYAAYLAVRSRKIHRAVAFDAEGFSPEFFVKYAHRITTRAHKITNTSAAGDPVHRLLNPLPGAKLRLIATPKQTNPFLYHKPTVLLDAEGRFRPPAAKELVLPKALAAFSQRTDHLPLRQRQQIAHAITDRIKSMMLKPAKRAKIKT